MIFGTRAKDLIFGASEISDRDISEVIWLSTPQSAADLGTDVAIGLGTARPGAFIWLGDFGAAMRQAYDS
jgi:hypothetical protein